MKDILTSFGGVLYRNYPLAEYTSWKIGGVADYFYQPANLKDLVQFMKVWKLQPIIMLGAATNVLIRDSGIRGAVIYLRNCLNELDDIDGCTLRAEAGVGLARLVQKCSQLGMIDAAFMAGIPGTVGGALAMNAGAYGDCIWNHVVTVETVNRMGEVRTRMANEFTPAYREVVGLDKEEWFVAAIFRFTRGDLVAAQNKISAYFEKRKNSQPLDLPSCGSVFRNPSGNYAARLIEASGLKGKQIGGARISEKHANFIVNCGGATAKDVEALMKETVVVIEQTHGIRLIAEVHVLGEV